VLRSAVEAGAAEAIVAGSPALVCVGLDTGESVLASWFTWMMGEIQRDASSAGRKKGGGGGINEVG